VARLRLWQHLCCLPAERIVHHTWSSICVCVFAQVNTPPRCSMGIKIPPASFLSREWCMRRQRSHYADSDETWHFLTKWNRRIGARLAPAAPAASAATTKTTSDCVHVPNIIFAPFQVTSPLLVKFNRSVNAAFFPLLTIVSLVNLQTNSFWKRECAKP